MWNTCLFLLHTKVYLKNLFFKKQNFTSNYFLKKLFLRVISKIIFKNKKIILIY